MDNYSKEALSRDLWLMVKAGLLDIAVREDGEPVYVISEMASGMSEDERLEVLNRLEDFDNTLPGE